MKYNRYDKMPEGAISVESIDKIHFIRMLEEGGAEDLIPVLNVFARGQLLEEQGKYNEATALYKESLKFNPKNRWLEEAAKRVKYTLN